MRLHTADHLVRHFCDWMHQVRHSALLRGLCQKHQLRFTLPYHPPPSVRHRRGSKRAECQRAETQAVLGDDLPTLSQIWNKRQKIPITKIIQVRRYREAHRRTPQDPRSECG